MLSGLGRWNVKSIRGGDGGHQGIEVAKGLRQLAVDVGGWCDQGIQLLQRFW